jgi:hypothetical protein
VDIGGRGTIVSGEDIRRLEKIGGRGHRSRRVSPGAPAIELGFERVDTRELVVEVPMDRQPFELFPAAGSPDIALQIGSDLLPGFEPLAGVLRANRVRHGQERGKGAQLYAVPLCLLLRSHGAFILP